MTCYINTFFNEVIDKSQIKTIIELGSRGGDEAIDLSNFYIDAVVHTFECNPNILERTKKTLKDKEKILLHEVAVSDVEEEINFYPINEANPGASSFLKPVNGTLGTDCKSLDPVVVKTVRLEDYLLKNNIHNVDMICADIQGYELKAFEGMGKIFNTVKYVIMEIPKNNPTYIDAPNRKEVMQYMNSKNLYENRGIVENAYEDNVLFVRKND